MKRPEVTEGRAGSSAGTADEAFLKKYPTVSAYLTDEKWEDGKSREVSGLAFTIRGGVWQVALNDKALKTSMYTCGSCMADCLKGLEAALLDGTGEWRPWKRGK